MNHDINRPINEIGRIVIHLPDDAMFYRDRSYLPVVIDMADGEQLPKLLRSGDHGINYMAQYEIFSSLCSNRAQMAVDQRLLSRNAILALNGGAKRGGFAHNTGEGGLSPYHLEPGGDVVWQIDKYAQAGSDTLLMEGHEEFTDSQTGERKMNRYMGSMVFRDGKIAVWRDYFQMGPAPTGGPGSQTAASG